MKTTPSVLLCLMLLVTIASCKRNSDVAVISTSEDRQAKELLQGVWIEDETEEISFRVKGDSIFFPDSTSLPAYFRIVADSFYLGGASYLIEKQSPHLFWFRNQTGDVVKLSKSDDPDDELDFQRQPAMPITLNEVVKTDSVVMFGGQRYHWYVAVNPTRYKVQKTSYNDDGVGVENVYYDNIINISLFKGAEKLFSRDFRKQMYIKNVPPRFLDQAILGNMQFDHIDARGFHFNATLCIPDAASCYLVEALISYKGELKMQTIEY
jgi:hypothetical protein